MSAGDCGSALAELHAFFDDLRRMGIDRFHPEPLPAELPVCPPGSSGHSPGAGAPCRRETLSEVRADLGDCRRCKLCSGRQSIVFGVGNPQARLVLVGEAPGREEDERGEPFVGEAGRLLDRILFAMGLTRAEFYICNILKCRPPGNRDPEPDEVAACEPFLRRQLAAMRPEVIVSLGRISAQTLLQEATPISRLRGRWRSYEGIPLLPTFHPAYLLRNPGEKREVWEDMKQVLVRLRDVSGGG